jgi:O-antigen/teichoic acid export membrane protein
VDQGLISGSNFLISIWLARWLPPDQYGAYALAYQIFLVLALFYQTLIQEPMMVFGASVYRDSLREYLGVVLRIHLRIALSAMLILGLSAWLVEQFAASHSLSGALAGVAFAAPWLLFFWLLRRVFYVQLKPQVGVSGALLYSVIILSGLLVVHRLGLVSPFSAFLLMAVGGLAVGYFLLVRLKPALKLGPRHPTLAELGHRHWTYGRWALATLLVSRIPSSAYYFLLGRFFGLGEVGAMKALFNLTLPAGHVYASFGMLSLPHAARTHHQGGPAGVQRVAWKLALLYAGGAVAYWIPVVVFREPVLHFVYAGKYTQVAHLVPWLAVGSVLGITARAQNVMLRAMQSPASVFVAYAVSGAIDLLIGLPATSLLGLRGAVFTEILSSAAALFVGRMQLRRAFEMPGEAKKPDGTDVA